MKKKKKKKKKTTLIIIFDSILKRVSGAKLSSTDIEKKELIEVKSFSRATANCLEHHIQPTLRKIP